MESEIIFSFYWRHFYKSFAQKVLAKGCLSNTMATLIQVSRDGSCKEMAIIFDTNYEVDVNATDEVSSYITFTVFGSFCFCVSSSAFFKYFIMTYRLPF